MTNAIISLVKDNKKIVYISVEKRNELLSSLAHKLRFKSMLYNCLVAVYHPDMNMENMLTAGWSIKEDNRNGYVENIKIVPSYTKKSKKEERCALCGQSKKKV